MYYRYNTSHPSHKFSGPRTVTIGELKDRYQTIWLLTRLFIGLSLRRNYVSVRFETQKRWCLTALGPTSLFPQISIWSCLLRSLESALVRWVECVLVEAHPPFEFKLMRAVLFSGMLLSREYGLLRSRWSSLLRTSSTLSNTGLDHHKITTFKLHHTSPLEITWLTFSLSYMSW